MTWAVTPRNATIKEQITKILIVDDNQRCRKTVRNFLASEPDLKVVGEATDGPDGVAKAIELKPDVILMDISMPGMNGIDATRQLKHEMPEARVVILTIYEMEEYRQAAIDSGADGYVLKKSIVDELAPAIRRAAGHPECSAKGTGGGQCGAPVGAP